MKKNILVSLTILIILTKASAQQNQMINFNASLVNIFGVPQVHLTWEAIENCSCYFTVERDSNALNNFMPFNNIPGFGTSTAHNYLSTDYGPFSPSVTYCYRVRLDTMDCPSTTCYFNSYTDTLCTLFTAIPEISSASISFTIHPNPTLGEIVISSNNNMDDVEIYNVLGERIYQSAASLLSYKIDLSNQVAGVYLLKVKIKKDIFYKKIVKQG